jgi:hypothetical protein
MTTKEVFFTVRKTLLLSLIFSYLSSSFYRWEFNPGKWTQDGRGIFIACYITYSIITFIGNLMIRDLTNNKY